MPNDCEEFISSLVEHVSIRSEVDRDAEGREGLELFHEGRREAFEEVLGLIRVSRFWPREALDPDPSEPPSSPNWTLVEMSPQEQVAAKRDALALIWADVEATRETEYPPLDHPEFAARGEILERWVGHEGALTFALTVIGSQAIKLLARIGEGDPADLLRELSLLVIGEEPQDAD